MQVGWPAWMGAETSGEENGERRAESGRRGDVRARMGRANWYGCWVGRRSIWLNRNGGGDIFKPGKVWCLVARLARSRLSVAALREAGEQKGSGCRACLA